MWKQINLPPPSLHCAECSPDILSEPEPVGLFLWIKAQNLPCTECAYTKTGPWMCLGKEGSYCIYNCLRGNDTQGNFLGQCKPRLFAPDNKSKARKWKLCICCLWTLKTCVMSLNACKIALCLRFCRFFTQVENCHLATNANWNHINPCQGKQVQNIFWLSTSPAGLRTHLNTH